MEIDYGLIFGYDKSQHLFTYITIALFLGILLIFVSGRHTIYRRINLLWLALVFIGLAEEYRQLLLPNRSAEWLDAFYNMIGASIGLAIPVLIVTSFKRNIIFPLKQIVFYCILLSPLFFGLLYFNEEPFITFNEPIKETFRNLAALIQFH